MKKAMVLILTAMLAVTAFACSNTPKEEAKSKAPESKITSQIANDSTEPKDDNQNAKFVESGITTIGGFTFSLPEGVSTDTSHYGYTFEYGDFYILIDNVLDEYTEKSKDIITMSQETLFHSLWSESPHLFDLGTTKQEISSKEDVSYNGIDMTKVKGNMISTTKNTSVPYVAYYFVRYDYPQYIIGINKEGKEDPMLEEFMDEFISYVRPEEE